MIEITLPWPPTVNTYWRNFNGRTIISKRGREYRHEVLHQVLQQKADLKIDYAMKIEIQAFRPDRRRRDLDNLLKALLDSLAHANVMQDDALVEDLRVYWADESGGYVKITIEGI